MSHSKTILPHWEVKIIVTVYTMLGLLYLIGCEGQCDRMSHGRDALAHSELKVSVIEVSHTRAVL